MARRFWMTALTLLALLTSITLLCSAARAQRGEVTAPYTTPWQPPSNPQHAGQHALAVESNILIANTITLATGERPISDFPISDFHSPKEEVSLGEAARAYRRAEGIKTIMDKEN